MKEEIKTLCFSDIQEALKVPFSASDVSWKPQATNNDKTKALAAVFAEPRIYEDRLNKLCPDDWGCSVELSQYVKFVQVPEWKNTDKLVWKAIGYVQAVARVNICGILRSSTGEEQANDKNSATCAEAQAFKRACSKFGLGRFMYSSPPVWAEIDTRGKFTPEALKMLARGLPSNGSTGPPPDSTPSEPSNAPEQPQEQAPGMVCQGCGNAITRDEWDYSNKFHKRGLCKGCQPKSANPNKSISPKQHDFVKGLCKNKGIDPDALAGQRYGKATLASCNSAEASELIAGLQDGTIVALDAGPSVEDAAEAQKFAEEIDLDDDDPFKEKF